MLRLNTFFSQVTIPKTVPMLRLGQQTAVTSWSTLAVQSPRSPRKSSRWKHMWSSLFGSSRAPRAEGYSPLSVNRNFSSLRSPGVQRWPRSKVGTPVATSLLGLLVGVLVWTFFLGNSEQHWQVQHTPQQQLAVALQGGSAAGPPNEFREFLKAQLEQASAIGVVPANITRAPAAATCGAWQKPYSTFHAKARAKLERTKVLVFSCRSGVGGGDNTCRGLGAPLVGISTAFLLARLTGRAFFVDWAALEGAFEPQHGGIEWRASQAPGVPQLVAEAPGGAAPPPPECNFGEPGGAGSATTIAGGISLNLVGRKVSGSELAACLGQLKDTHVVQVQMDASFDTWAAVVPEDVTGGTPGGIVAVHPFSSGCLLHYLLRPSRIVEDAILSVASEIRSVSTFAVCVDASPLGGEPGLTVAGGDAGDSSQILDGALACAQQAMEYWAPAGMRHRVYVMSPDGAVLDEAKRRNPSKTLVLSGPAGGGSLQGAAESWALFSDCNLHVHQTSALAMTAARYMLKPLAAYVYSKESGECTLTYASSPSL